MVTFKGLGTGYNPLDPEAEGGCWVADNVVFRQPGIVEPRLGFTLTSGIPGTTYGSTQLVYYDSRIISYDREQQNMFQTSAYSSPGVSWSAVSGGTSIGLPITSGPAYQDRLPYATAQQCLFWGTSAGMKVMESGTGALSAAGIPRAPDIPSVTLSAGAGAWAWSNSNNSKVAYSAVWGYKDSFNRVILGPPSGRVIVANSAAADRFTTSYIPVPPWATTSNFVRLYRSETSAGPSVDPDENQYLVYEQKVADVAFTVTTGNLSKANGSTTVTATYTAHGLSVNDYVQISLQGTETYFRSGIYQVTAVPTADTFQYSDGLNNGSGSSKTSGNATKVAPCIVINDYTPDSLLQDPLYTNPADGEGLLASNYQPPVAGSMAWWQDRMWFGNTKSKHRFNLRMLGIGAPNGVQAADTITVAGVTFTASAGAPASALEFQVSAASTVALQVEETSKNLVQAINQRLAGQYQAYYVSGANEPPGKILIEEYGLGGSSFTVYASRQGSWHPYLTTGSTGAVASDNDQVVNRVYYSKIGQPEAVPLLNYVDVGEKNAPILGIYGLGTTLYVFKTDGLFTITGQGVFRVSLLDSTLVLRAVHSLAAIGDVLYALASTGVVAISSTGIRVVDTPIHDLIQSILTRHTLLSDVQGVGDPRFGEYTLLFPTSLLISIRALVYNAKNRAWATHSDEDSIRFTCGCLVPAASSSSVPFKVFGTVGTMHSWTNSVASGAMYIENHAGTYLDYGDDCLNTVTVSAASATTVTLSAGTLVVGDGAYGSGSKTLVVTAVQGGGVYTVTWSPSHPTGGLPASYTRYRRIISDVRSLPVASRNGALQHTPAAVVHFKDRQASLLYLYAASNLSTSPETVALGFAAASDGGALPGNTYSFKSNDRAAIPQVKQRNASLSVGLKCTQAFGFFQLLGIDIQVTGEGSRSSR